MSKTRVMMITNNPEGYGQHPPYFKIGDKGYIDGYNNTTVFIVLDDYSQLCLASPGDFKIIEQLVGKRI